MLRLSQELKDIKTFGISYEADILPSPVRTYTKILSFLELNTTEAQRTAAEHSMHHKGLLCTLSDMLVNYDELICTLNKFDEKILERYGVEEKKYALSWMSADKDSDAVSFEVAMRSWKRLWDSIQWGYLKECSGNELRASSQFVSTAYVRTSSADHGKGMSGSGGQTQECKTVPAAERNPFFCMIAMHRLRCDTMTMKSGKDCILHKRNSTDFKLVTCDPWSFYRDAL